MEDSELLEQESEQVSEQESEQVSEQESEQTTEQESEQVSEQTTEQESEQVSEQETTTDETLLQMQDSLQFIEKNVNGIAQINVLILVALMIALIASFVNKIMR